jgi:acetyltransferase-like isoleucine patch superfamily enzyme
LNLAAWYLRLRYPRVLFGPGFSGPWRLRIRGPGRVTFGRDVRVSNASGKTALLTFSEGASITVGDRVVMDGAGVMAASQIVIEEGAVLGPCLLVDTDFHAIGPERRMTGAEPSRRPIRIGRNAWVQAKATVLKGVTVGEDAVVRWAAVVASDVAPGLTVLGNPAVVDSTTTR